MKASTPVLSGSLALASVPRTAVALRWRFAVLIGFVITYLALQIGTCLHRSPTYDEPVHLTAGYAALVNGDRRIDPCHPPLVRMWAALPLLATQGLRFDSAAIDALPPNEAIVLQNTLAHGFLYAGHDVDQLVNRGRFMIILLGALLGVLVFCWVQELLGFPMAVLALGLYLMSPNLGAHAALVTTDLGITCFVFGTLYFLWRTGRAFSVRNVAGFAGFFALAMVTKFSAVLLVPTCGLLGLFALRRPGQFTWRRLGLLVAITGGATWLAIWAVYGFRYAPSATGGWLFGSQDFLRMQEEMPGAMRLLGWIDAHRLLPNAYTQGFLLSLFSAENLPSYLAGEISHRGWWYYYPLAILVKTPIAQLLLLVAGLGTLLWQLRVRALMWDALCLVLPVAVYLGAAMTTEINIGVRHVLPIYPFFVVFACVAIRQLYLSLPRPSLGYGIVGGLLAVWATTFAAAYPHTLTFFNLAVGGPKRGSDYLVDSNLDWGQHLKLLKKWMDERGVARINLAYFGVDDPAYRGISCVILPGTREYLAARVAKPELPGYVAISETVAKGVYLPPAWREFYAGFAQLKPVAVIGHTLKVYHVEHWPEPPKTSDEETVLARAVLAELLHAGGWPEQAAALYRHCLEYWPGDLALHVHLARALGDAGDLAAAERSYQRAVELAQTPAIDQQLAVRLINTRQFRAAIEPAFTLTQLLPQQPAARDLLGLALAGEGRLAEAKREFETAVSAAPAEPAFRRHLDLVLRQMSETVATGR